MRSDNQIILLTDRDLDVLSALVMTPLTAEQLCKLSRSFRQPFPDARRVRERLRTLADVGRVNIYRYATAGPGAPAYYSLTPLGYRLLHGAEADLPGRAFFAPVGIARQRHTFALAEFVMHTLVCAHNCKVEMTHFGRENAVFLKVGDEMIAPDASFQLVHPESKPFNFVVEVDNCSERVRSEKEVDSWERKVRLYETYANQSPGRFRVLLVTTGSERRLGHMLAVAHHLARNPRRALVYGVCLSRYLAEPNGLFAGCWQDHRGTAVPLLLAIPARPTSTSVVR